MKRFFLPLAALLMSAIPSVAADGADTDDDNVTITVFDAVTFYDGYAGRHPDADLQDGILRHRSSLMAVKLTPEQLDLIGERLSMNLTIEACCDNYDRIGNVNLALVDKGAATYSTADVQRIEIGRFITPFMNTNVAPRRVPYSYWLDYLSPILRDATLRENYDLWLEFEIFGIPYSANKEVMGCAGRSDTFKGTLKFVTSRPALTTTDDNILVPVVMKRPEYQGGNLNNYQEIATDLLGTTSKTYTFTLDEDVADSQIVLVTSNHGANEGGEEYKRRWHYVKFDDNLVLSYIPGRESCEPFRRYNTQANTIYGYSERTDEMWQSFSNWCPGDVIDNRIINLGPLTAGTHTINLSVPDAEFVGGQGDIPVSIFFQGARRGKIPASIAPAEIPGGIADAFTLDVDGRTLTVVANASAPATLVEVHDASGRCVRRQYDAGSIDASSWAPGLYLVSVTTTDGLITTRKLPLR